MTIDVDRLSDELAADSTITDYDFWRALRTVNNEIFDLNRKGAPIPIRHLHLRAILRKARAKRRSWRSRA